MMEPEKKKRIEDEFVIIDEQEELRRAEKEQARHVALELHAMTYIQREELKSQAQKTIGGWAAGFGFALVLTFLFLSTMSGRSGNSMGIIVFMVGGFSLFALIMGLIKWSQMNADLQHGRVEYVEGMITLDISGGGRSGPTYKLTVASETFTINKDLFLSLSNHQPYRIFYAPQSRFILGTEPL